MSALELTERLEAHEPPEVRGLGRDDVAMLVSTRHDGSLADVRFRDLPGFLRAGDLVVVNTSATLPAALDARLGGRPVELRLSTPAAPDTAGGDASWGLSPRHVPNSRVPETVPHWIVELRTAGGMPFRRPPTPASLELPGGAGAELLAPFAGSERLVVARLDVGEPVVDYLHRHGRPIRYGYVPRAWPLAAYQTVFSAEPGSAEMPSAGRPFTHPLVTELACAGVLFAPVTLHTGVSSLERGESPYPERYHVPRQTLELVAAVRGWGGRVIAVGTTVVRALETAAATGDAHEAADWTRLVVTPERGLLAVDGLLTGWHEPESSHLQLLDAVAGRELRVRSYHAALANGYRWHEFGDVHLILP